jgi:hypothetical protein
MKKVTAPMPPIADSNKSGRLFCSKLNHTMITVAKPIKKMAGYHLIL